MLAHLKGKRRGLEFSQDNNECFNVKNMRKANRNNSQQSQQQQQQHDEEDDFEAEESNPSNEEDYDDHSATQMTCDVLCSLGASVSPPQTASSFNENSRSEKQRRASKSCPKQHQLPMFLSKTYHMIDRCDSTIATWSEAGDNFVVKNVEKFAGSVLPLYFKHSNFSSFARQLNFYGFRKLRTDPILTSDVDPSTACYVRFYHEKFQKDRPELLHQIKRATKSDQQSKDDVESLKGEVSRLKESIGTISADFDRKLAEMSYEYNRRINVMSADYDKLATYVQQTLSHTTNPPVGTHESGMLPSASPPAVSSAAMSSEDNTADTIMDTVSSSSRPETIRQQQQRVPDLMESLSQAAAMSFQNSVCTDRESPSSPPPPPPPPGNPSGYISEEMAAAHSSDNTVAVTTYLSNNHHNSQNSYVASMSTTSQTIHNTTTATKQQDRQQVPDLMKSLSQVAAVAARGLQNNSSSLNDNNSSSSNDVLNSLSDSFRKRNAEDENGEEPSTRRRATRPGENVCVR